MKNENEPRIDDIVVSPKVLADTLGITDRQIRNLAEQGIVEKTDKGRYLFKSSVKAYITLLKVAQRSKEEKERFGDSLDLEEEKAKHEVLKREITEIRLQLIKGSSFSHRSKIAAANDITGYKGTSEHNIRMVNLLKRGKLIKP